MKSMVIDCLRKNKILCGAACLVLVATLSVLGINSYVKASISDNIISAEQSAQLGEVDCVLVLGCGVDEDGNPKGLLTDRLTTAVSLYEGGAASKLLMSGDHGRVDYDEVNAMKQYAIEHGVPSADIFMDHAGFSTYESVYRARDVFAADKIIIVTQAYHLSRALYIADKLGLEAYGVASDLHRYKGEQYREFREALARCKDWVVAVIQPEPTYLGEVIPVNGNGDITNDEAFQ